MVCDVCQRPAAAQCSDCNAPFCSDHAGSKCFRCAGALAAPAFSYREVSDDTGICATEKEARHPRRGYLQCYTRPAMETIYIDDPGPPACYECDGLARHICFHCHQLFCDDHCSKKDLCVNCARSSRLGLLILLGSALLLTAVLWLTQLIS